MRREGQLTGIQVLDHVRSPLPNLLVESSHLASQFRVGNALGPPCRFHQIACQPRFLLAQLLNLLCVLLQFHTGRAKVDLQLFIAIFQRPQVLLMIIVCVFDAQADLV